MEPKEPRGPARHKVLTKVSSLTVILLSFFLFLILLPFVPFSGLSNRRLRLMHTRFSLWRTTQQFVAVCGFAASATGRFRSRSPILSRAHPKGPLSDMTHPPANGADTATLTYEIANNFSLGELYKRLQNFVNHPNHPALVLAVAGGGGHLLSSLSSTPGASQVLLQASILYDRESYRRYIQQSNQVSLESPSFRYASIQASGYAASASLKEALEICAAANTTYGKQRKRTRPINVACLLLVS